MEEQAERYLSGALGAVRDIVELAHATWRMRQVFMKLRAYYNCMQGEIEESYFYDDVFFGKKSQEMVEFPKTRIDVALDMVRRERLSSGSILRILDVGCGDGTCSKKISDMGNDVCAVDVRQGKAREASLKGIKVIVADLEKGMPFAPASFDLVYATEVLEHVYDTEFFLQEARRVMNKNGVLIVTVPNLACLPNRLRMIFGLYPKYIAPARKHWGVGEHVRAFTKNMITELLMRNGFRIEDVKANVVSFVPTRRTRKPWSKRLAKAFPGLGEILICKARVDLVS